jgi:TetR/AcrR family transcriptional repressor of lmrAB and yxaGH operons
MKNKTCSREKILTAASMLFQVKGYNATGLSEILKESGSPKGSLYYYFPGGKEELALEAINESYLVGVCFSH